MTYQSWFNAHYKKHKQIIKKLVTQKLTKEQIIDYFDFDNMAAKEPDFCPLYAEGKPCHDMQNLNCYLCACPFFRFYDTGIKQADGMTRYSHCTIDCKDGCLSIFDNSIHQDCTNCTIPHNKEYIKKHFDLDWKNIMDDCKKQSRSSNG